MGAEPWLIRKPFIVSPIRVLQRFYDEILNATPDWPDIRIGNAQEAFIVTPLEQNKILDSFGTLQPESELSQEEIEHLLDNLWDRIERGSGHFLILYKDAQPVEVCFFGYSLD